MHEPMTVEDAAIELGARISTVRRRAALMHLPKFGKAYQISFAALELMRVALAAPAKRGPRADGLRPEAIAPAALASDAGGGDAGPTLADAMPLPASKRAAPRRIQRVAK